MEGVSVCKEYVNHEDDADECGAYELYEEYEHFLHEARPWVAGVGGELAHYGEARHNPPYEHACGEGSYGHEHFAREAVEVVKQCAPK